MNTINKNTENNLKIIFQKIGLENPSTDFTLSVMDRIVREPIPLPKQIFSFPKIFLLLLSIPVIAPFFFIPSLTDWIFTIQFNLSFLNLNIVRDWGQIFFKSLHLTTSPALLSIFMASSILVVFFAILQYYQTESTD